MSSNVDINFGYSKGRGTRRHRKSAPVSNSRSQFRMKEQDEWPYAEEGSQRSRQDQAMRAFGDDTIVRLPDRSIQRRVAEAVIHCFPHVEIPTSIQMSRTEAAVRHVKHQLIKSASTSDERYIRDGIGIARGALAKAYSAL